MKCIIEGCEKEYTTKSAKGLCRSHYYKLLRYGNAEHKFTRKLIDRPKYSTIHKRLYKEYGPAEDYNCLICNKIARDWACINKEVDGIVNGYTIQYSYNIEDYLPLCKQCHVILDRSEQSEECMRGHNDWYKYNNSNKRYCRTCANELRRIK